LEVLIEREKLGAFISVRSLPADVNVARWG